MSLGERTVFVFGVGNTLREDDGVGVVVVRDLHRLRLRSVRCIEAGMWLLDYLNEIESARLAIFVDAGRMGESPGTVRFFDGENLPHNDFRSAQLHSEALRTILGLILALEDERGSTCGNRRVIRIALIQPAQTGFHSALSPLLRERLPDIIRRIKEEIERLQGCMNSE